MRRSVEHQSRDEFKAVDVDRFGANWLCMKRTIGLMKKCADGDTKSVAADGLPSMSLYQSED